MAGAPDALQPPRAFGARGSEQPRLRTGPQSRRVQDPEWLRPKIQLVLRAGSDGLALYLAGMGMEHGHAGLTPGVGLRAAITHRPSDARDAIRRSAGDRWTEGIGERA
jgi:hypothetical protein